MPKRDRFLSRFINTTWLRSVCTGLFAGLATTAFAIALLFGKDAAMYNIYFNALSVDLNMTALAILILFGIFAALSVALVLIQFKRPSTTVLLASVQFAVLIVALLLTNRSCTYKATSQLMYTFSLIFTLLLFLIGLFSYIYCEKKVTLKGEGRVRSLVIMGLSLLAEASVFFVPLLGFTDSSGNARSEVLFHIFSATKNTLMSSILFTVYFVVFIATILVAVNHFKYLHQDNDAFNGKLGRIVYLSSGVTLTFFLVGTLIAFYYRTQGIHSDASSISFIPFVLSLALLFVDAIYNGRYKEIRRSLNRKGLAMRILMLVFIFLFTALTIVSLFSNLIIANFENEFFGQLKVNGFDVLSHYKEYGESYQTLAFLLMGVIAISSLLLIISALSFFRNSKLFKSMFLASVGIDFFNIAALAAFAKYYEVVQKANVERMKSLLTAVGIPLDVQYHVSSDVLYYFIAAVVLLLLVFLFRPYTTYVIEENARDEIKIGEDSVIGVEQVTKEDEETAEQVGKQPLSDGSDIPPAPSPSAVPENAISAAADIAPREEAAPLSAEEKAAPAPSASKPTLPVIDQCPPFTFLDEQAPVYLEKLAERRATEFEEVTLKSLVEFVVDYAKNSRLHLSYTTEDIATFVAGLGIGRLSILQGMSGTGKTSLPKIFSEAIFGNCEIVEVESSWKDKNELLGYYNEFSRIYTPKKFTQDLYKAKHNPDVITFIVLDEMNLSRIEYYFSDFLSLMENEEDKREIKLVNIRIANYESGERVSYRQLTDDMVLKIPNNVWFIGTANRDESTFEISDKVYDRASTMNFDKRAKKITKFDAPMSPRFLDVATFRNLLNAAMENVNFDLSSAKQIAKAEELLAPYNLSFGNRIERQIENFVKIYSACFKGKNVAKEALEKIFLSKVVAKLEFKTVENKEELAEGFEEIGMSKCAAFIRKLNEDI